MVKRLRNIHRSRFVRSIVNWLDNIQPPGFRGMSLWFVLRFFFEGIQKGGIGMRAASISFKLFIAFFPGIILLLSIIPYIPVKNFQDNLLSSIAGIFPGDTFSLFETTLTELVSHKYNTLLSIGLILVIYYASNSVSAILQGFNESYHVEERGNFWVIQFASVILIFVLGFFMILAVSMIIFSGVVFGYLREVDIIPSQGIEWLLEIVKWVISTFLIYTVLSTLYNVGNANKRKKFRYFNPGATFATIFFIISSILFAWFVNNFSNYNKLYGSLGTLLLLLIWLNFNCTILLLGYELNVSINKAHRHKPVPPVPPPVNSLKE